MGVLRVELGHCLKEAFKDKALKEGEWEGRREKEGGKVAKKREKWTKSGQKEVKSEEK